MVPEECTSNNLSASQEECSPTWASCGSGPDSRSPGPCPHVGAKQSQRPAVPEHCLHPGCRKESSVTGVMRDTFRTGQAAETLLPAALAGAPHSGNPTWVK